MGNHWSDDGDLIIEDKTMFRQVGWLSHDNVFWLMGADDPRTDKRIPFGPVYVQISTWVNGEGWHD